MAELTDSAEVVKADATGLALPDEAQVIAYLKADPLLLTRHPQLLEHVEITHAAGSAVSLIERQVELLRGKNQRLESRLDKLLETAKDNELRADKVLKLALSLIRAPSLAAIRTLNRATVKYALELGYMKIQAKDVPKPELAQLIEWLPESEGSVDSWTNAARCPVKVREVKLTDQPRTSTTFGVTGEANRAQTAKETGLTRAQMKDLEVAWVAAFPQTPAPAFAKPHTPTSESATSGHMQTNAPRIRIITPPHSLVCA